MKNFKYLLYGLLTILVIAGIGIAYVYNAPKASVDAKKVDYTLSATELFQEYSENQAIADQKFINRVIEVTGTIFEISEDQQGATVFFLDTGESNAGVLCTMTLEDTQKVTHKKVGDAITIKGFCSGMLMEVVLNRCSLVN